MHKNISEYGLIGDMHSLALVCLDGSIDYCAMPHINSPSVFAALLDDGKGGYFKIAPSDRFNSTQSYIKDTNILKTHFQTDSAEAEITDFMPVVPDLTHAENHKSHVIRRYVKALSGSIRLTVEFMPRPDYARKTPSLDLTESRIYVRTVDEQFILQCNRQDMKWRINEHTAVSEILLQQGQALTLDFVYGERPPIEPAEEDMENTARYWQTWLAESVADNTADLNEYFDDVCRSLLTLKLLVFEPTGAIAAAATTSLPEALGAQRNWDYRFSWLRDSSWSLRSFFFLGHVAEAESFIRFLHDTYRRYGSERLQIVYSLQGESEIPEQTLEHLTGYKNSYPVRIGNDAYKQNQWDIYGEVMDSALRLSDYAGRIDEDLWPFFRDICDLAIKNFSEPDSGIWEVRIGPQHYVYSKIMCWVAVDRGIKIANRYGFDAPLEQWEEARQNMKQEILSRGFSQELNSFVQFYDSSDVDASLLSVAVLDFLPVTDSRIQGTIDACQRELMKKGFLARYVAHDGMEGAEGAFVLCNFWLVEALAISGKNREAKELLATTMQAGNHLGLFAEEYDPQNKELLGNFPQAFSHIGFINAVIAVKRLGLKKKRRKDLTAFKSFFKKIIPLPVTLNKHIADKEETSGHIAVMLKKSLNDLQGAFFNVQESRVDYAAMRKSESFRKYIELAGQLQIFDPFTLRTDSARKAFWINIYNILIIHAVVHYNVNRSVKEVPGFFKRPRYNIGGYLFSPDDIEHGILRGNRPRPGSKRKQLSDSDSRNKLTVNELDPRIHFALVCAASSCPPIEFYDAERIDNQLDVAGRSFLLRRGLSLDKKRSVIYLSRIFEWYDKEFAAKPGQLLPNILVYADPDTRDYIENNLDRLRIKYHIYNWNLNKALS